MLLEAIDRPFRFHFSDGSEVRLTPGAPIQLDEARARRLLEKMPGKVKVVTPVSPSESITWEGADLMMREGTVDFLHTDVDGTVWAFVTMPSGGWVAVNTKYVERIDPLRRPYAA